jgi:hypothetical protein
MNIDEFFNSLVIPRTRDGLVRLYIQIASDKPEYQFDPKRMIFDVLPAKADLFKVSMVNHAYSLAKLREDHPKLNINEHRFVNFLKFTLFTLQEIDAVFDAYENSRPRPERPESTHPSRWDYSMVELYQFLKSATTKDIVLPLSESEGISFISPRQMDMLYEKDYKEKKKLRTSMYNQ